MVNEENVVKSIKVSTFWFKKFSKQWLMNGPVLRIKLKEFHKCLNWHYAFHVPFRMLDEFHHEMDNTEGRLDNTMKKMAKVMHMSNGKYGSTHPSSFFVFVFFFFGFMAPHIMADLVKILYFEDLWFNQCHIGVW